MNKVETMCHRQGLVIKSCTSQYLHIDYQMCVSMGVGWCGISEGYKEQGGQDMVAMVIVISG